MTKATGFGVGGFLSRAAHTLSSSLSFEDTLVRTVQAALPDLGDFGFFDVVEGDGVRRTVAAHEAPDIEALLRPTAWVRNERTDINLCALSSGEPALHTGLDDAWYRSIAVAPPHLELLRALAFRSMITVPMRYRGELVGALTLFMGRSGREHGPDEFAAARDLAALAAPLVVNARLVRQHERAEAALREADARLRLAVEAGEMGIWEWDVARDHVIWSDRVYSLHGLAPGEFGGAQVPDRASASTFGGTAADFARLVHPEDAERVQQRIEAALQDGAEFKVDFRAVWPDGSVRWLTTSAQVRRSADGTPLRLVGLTYDITARMDALEAERRAREAADASNRAKDGFLAMLGHELRNPLAPIVSALNLIEAQAPDSFARERAVIQRQVNHLRRLVDDLLDVARITRGDLRLQRERLPLRAALSAALEMAGPLVELRGHQLKAELPPPEVTVEGDAARLAQVFANLLNNAARYTPDGGSIAVRCAVADGSCRIEIADNGQGIPAALLPRVFDLFVQGAQGPERSVGGLGVGLALVRTLVRLHGGSVEAHSEGAGRGSRFTVRLPLAAALRVAPASVPPPESLAGGAGRRVLVVDDNRDAATTLTRLLGHLGYRASMATDPASALALAGESGIRFDLAILDLGLPGMDGYELARRLRQTPGQEACRLIALSGYAQPSDRERSARAGFASHLAKPVDMAELSVHLQDPGVPRQ